MLKKITLFILIACSVQSSFSKITLNTFNKYGNVPIHINSLNSDSTIITVKITKGHSASFYYNDEFDDTTPPVFFSDQDHVKKLSIRYPTLLIDSYHQIPFLIYPGEKLTLQTDNQGIPILTAGNNNIRNNELNLFVAYFKTLNHKINSILYYYKPASIIPKSEFDFQKIIDAAKSDSSKRFRFLRDYQKSTTISSNFARYTNEIFKYLYIYNVLTPIYYSGVDVKKLPSRYTNYVDSIKAELNCDSCLLNPSYRRANLFLRHYLIRKFERGGNLMSLCYDTVSSSFNGETRRYLLFILLKGYIPAPPVNYEKKYAQFINEKNDMYSGYLIKQRALTNQFKSDDNIKEVADSEGKKYSFDEILSRHKGYIIYMDFWASWCAPCRYNMAFAEKLKTYFKGQKIIFLDVSIDANPTDWKKAMSEDHMDKRLNYLLVDSKNSQLNRRFRIETIPRYFIISKAGIIVDANAAYPNNIKIKKILAHYLEQ